MAIWKPRNTESTGSSVNRSRWTSREEAKDTSRHARRIADEMAVREGVREHEAPEHDESYADDDVLGLLVSR